MHGGRSTGPCTVAGLERVRTARTKHGLYGAELVKLRRCCAEMQVDAKRMAEEF